MSIFSNFFKPKPVFNLPQDWTPNCIMRRIVNHWTAGSHIASALDREHYHFLVEGNANVVLGEHPVSDNVPPLREGEYAAHVRRANSRCIGIAACAMAGARANPMRYGKYPITRKQWDKLVLLNAALCRRYNIPITAKHVLMHGEVQRNLDIRQRGKWDIGALKFAGMKYADPFEVGEKLRAEVREAI